MGYVNECDVCGTEIIGNSEDELVGKMIRHANEQHDLPMAIEEAREKARRKPKGAPGVSGPQP